MKEATTTGEQGKANTPGGAVPAYIQGLDGIHTEIMRLAQDTERAAREIGEHYKDAIGADRGGMAVDSAMAQWLGDAMDRLAWDVSTYANKTLSTPGAPCAFTKSNLVPSDNWSRADAKWEHLTPSAMWQALVSAHDPDARFREIACNTANTLVQCLGLHRVNEGKTVSGKTEICVNLYNTLGWDRVRRIDGQLDNPINALAMFIEQAMPGAGLSFPDDMARALGRKTKIVSRERMHFSDGVEAVTFNQMVKLYLPKNITEALSLYVAEYADRHWFERRYT